jgi:hypothetical protein
MSSYLPIRDMSHWFYFWIEAELFWNFFTFLLIAHFIVIKTLFVIYFLFLEHAGLQYF